MTAKKRSGQKERDFRAERGRQARDKGLHFEERVAEVYRLLHYDVEVGRLFSGRQVDLLLTGRFGDLVVHRAIECKLGPVNVDDLDDFLTKLRLVRHDYPAVQGTIVTAVSFSDAVAAHGAREGISLTLFRDLSAQLLDGHRYATHLVRSCESNERYPAQFYIEPSIGWEPAGEAFPATPFLRDWLGDTSWNQLTLLGDVGTGKSFLCKMLAYELGRAFTADPLKSPLPILIDLRNADRLFTLEGLILSHLSHAGLSRVSFDVFSHALRNGHVVLILDGFDEMSARVAPYVTVRNFHELAKCVSGQAKVLLTCRTHYFRSRTEEEEIILGGGQDHASDSARELYWDLISRKGFRIAYLRPFSLSQIESYLQLRRPEDARQALEKLRETYNLLELSQRPMLLEMIVRSLDKIGASDINPAALYRVYTDAWIQRDHWRDVLSAEKKLAFLTSLARTLWSEDVSKIHYSVLHEHVRLELAGESQDPQRLIEIDNEVRTASFLTRDSVGNYEFAHQSYGEFFVARWLAEGLGREEFDCLRLKRLTPEVISFLFDLLDLAKTEVVLEALLVRKYVPLLSENALVLLYGLRRERWRRQQQCQPNGVDESVRVDLPRGAILLGAKLHHVSLEGAVLQDAQLEGASLQEAILVSADLSGSNLRLASFDSAMLTQARLARATLSSCSLRAANLGGACLDACEVTGADLSDAYLVGISAEEVDWSKARVNGAVFSDELLAVVRTKVSPEELLDRARQSRNQRIVTFWSVIEPLLPALRAHARTLSLRGSIEADDVVSEVLTNLASPQAIDQVVAMSGDDLNDYLFGAVRNSALVMMRRENRHWRLVNFSKLEGEDRGEDPFDDAGDVGQELAVLDEDDNLRSGAVSASQVYYDDPLDALLERERTKVFREVLADTEMALTGKFKSVFRRYYIEGLTIAKIEELEGIPRGTAARILYTTRRLLTRNLGRANMSNSISRRVS